MPVKSFKGLLLDGDQITINLHTTKGNIGYRIVKFEIMPNTPGVNIDAVVKIWKTDPEVAPAPTVDFSDNRLLAVAWNYNDTYETQSIITFDNEIFNQDIYVAHHDEKAANAMNWYIELEQIKLDIGDQTVATLKDIRNQV